ncbi:hypothetical protein X797_001494 [Metarhizium robertsii]|uniref:Uncharacterized protein n=1 Tax=Metarhizium robertsii TaxID=568076 RepID=A0A0A1V951_9HYPO|nr:hypothetical protein X797_001494 [Metarhizium robertsii]
MCSGHPRAHPCGHTSLLWNYCRSATFNTMTGESMRCGNVTFGTYVRELKSGCPLSECKFKAKGGNWVCCKCHRGPNRRGWCNQPVIRLRRKLGSDDENEKEEADCTCDHMCCDECAVVGTST